MATLKKSIMEAVETGINNALTSNITKEEAMEDYDKMNDLPSMPEKKAMAAKYGIDSKKAKDIQDAILKYLRGLRFSQNIFDDNDIRNFNRLGYYDSYKKEAELFEQEPNTFLKYLLDSRLNYLTKKGLDRYITYAPSAMRCTLGDKCAINRYKNIKRYFDENSSEYAAKVNAIEIIYNVLQTEMADYKKEYLNKVYKASAKFYDSIPNKMEQAKAEYDAALLKYDEWKKENPKAGWREDSEKHKIVSNAWSAFVNLRAIINMYTREAYIEDKVERASNEFDADTKSVATRINDRNVDATKLHVDDIHQDPKYFEMMISDGTQKFYARSVLAALDSEYMIPHYRFIITDRSKF